jgi:hypothetical protein
LVRLYERAVVTMVLDALDHLPDRLSPRAPRECVVADDHEQVPRAGQRDVQPGRKHAPKAVGV